MTLLERAKQIAEIAHRGQKRWGGEDYIIHPTRVSNQFENEELKIIALLHDVLEDCESITTLTLSSFGFSKRIVKALKAITKIPGESYSDYISRVAKNKLAKEVKIKDIEDNINSLPEENVDKKTKYLLAKYILKK